MKINLTADPSGGGKLHKELCMFFFFFHYCNKLNQDYFSNFPVQF